MFSATKGQRGCSHSKGRWRQHVNGEHGNVDSKISRRVMGEHNIMDSKSVVGGQ
jgi:hypothetical protein